DAETQAAFTFIKWMTSNPDRVAQWSMDTGYVAPRPEAYETEKMIKYAAEFPSALTARDQLEYAYAEFSVYDQGTVQDILDTAIELVMTGQQDAKTALDNAQAEAEMILFDYQ
ncbi:MAG: extracellular solute-binding protein, partial [Clostridia bacterium]|nr:extracellular solute-binding protein [Clostridia bacterium]